MIPRKKQQVLLSLLITTVYQFKELKLANCVQLKASGFKFLQLQSVTDLDLSGCSFVDDSIVKRLQKRCQVLIHLDLSRTAITGLRVSNILSWEAFDAPYLCSLKLVDCPLLSALYIRAPKLDYIDCPYFGLCKVSTKTRSLNLQNVSDQEIVSILPLIRDLEALDMKYCQLTDSGVSAMSNSFSQLSSLNLEKNRITFRGVEYLMRLKTLKVLKLDGNPISTERQEFIARNRKTFFEDVDLSLQYKTTVDDDNGSDPIDEGETILLPIVISGQYFAGTTS